VNFSTINFNQDGSFRRYTCFLLSCLFGGLAALGALTYSIDPYGIFGNNTLGIYISAEREAKTMMVHEYPHDVLLLGNSKSALVAVGGVKDSYCFPVATHRAGIRGPSSFWPPVLRKYKCPMCCYQKYHMDQSSR
jgi:hypothetical protein